MNPWYEELVKECETAHDKECEYGEECPERTSHIERVFVRHALKDRVVTLQARLAAVEKLYEERCAETVDNFTEAEELFLADLIKAARGE